MVVGLALFGLCFVLGVFVLASVALDARWLLARGVLVCDLDVVENRRDLLHVRVDYLLDRLQVVLLIVALSLLDYSVDSFSFILEQIIDLQIVFRLLR